MTETLFEIASYNKPLYHPSNQSSNSYSALLQHFATSSYGLYTELFIKKIASDILSKNEGLMKYGIKKILRKCVRKFMLTDLELVFLAHYCKKNEWQLQFEQEWREKEILDKIQGDEFDQKCVQLFLDLNAYFVKSYIGNKEQYEAIDSYILQVFPAFTQIYQKWVLNKPRQLFHLTPRNINELYRQFSRGEDVEGRKKDYNQLVDGLIDLSTTYSMIPNARKENKVKEKQVKDNKNEIFDEEVVGQKQKNSQRNLDRRTRKKSQIFKIAEDSQMLEQSQIQSFNPNFNSHLHNNNINNRPQRKSSLLFESLQSLSRKSSQLILTNKIKESQQRQKQPEPQRSRQKKPGNKISLNFKRKQKPNETVLGFVNQSSVLDIGMGLGEKQQKLRYDGRSLLNQSIKQHNMSFMNLRSNRSSRSNSQLPFLWKPSQDSFFQKSKLG